MSEGFDWKFRIGNEPLPCSIHLPVWRISSGAAVLYCLLFNSSRSAEPLQKKGQTKTSNRSSWKPRDPQWAMGLRSMLRRRELRAGRAPQTGGLAQTKAWRDPPSASDTHKSPRWPLLLRLSPSSCRLPSQSGWKSPSDQRGLWRCGSGFPPLRCLPKQRPGERPAEEATPTRAGATV